MQTTIHTARLALRPPTADDLDSLVELDSDPDVMRFLTGGRPTPRAEIEHDRLPGWLDYKNHYGFWIAELPSTSDFLGWFHLRAKPDDSEREPELGYRLGQTSWGNGFATEGSLALIEYAFTERGAERVYAETMAVNLASRRVMEKCGMRHARTFFEDWDDPIEGSDQGEVEYEITSDDWASLRRR